VWHSKPPDSKKLSSTWPLCLSSWASSKALPVLPQCSPAHCCFQILRSWSWQPLVMVPMDLLTDHEHWVNVDWLTEVTMTKRTLQIQWIPCRHPVNKVLRILWGLLHMKQDKIFPLEKLIFEKRTLSCSYFLNTMSVLLTYKILTAPKAKEIITAWDQESFHGWDETWDGFRRTRKMWTYGNEDLWSAQWHTLKPA
jgi:hypothetical protein